MDDLAMDLRLFPELEVMILKSDEFASADFEDEETGDVLIFPSTTESPSPCSSAEEDNSVFAEKNQLPTGAMAMTVTGNIDNAEAPPTTSSKTPIKPVAQRRYVKRAQPTSAKSISSLKKENGSLSKSVLFAREHRQRKKQYLEDMEETRKRLTTANETLRSLSTTQLTRISNLKLENKHLYNILERKTDISSLLQNTQFASYLSTQRSQSVEDRSNLKDSSAATVGVCVHVSNKKVALEFCPYCNIRSAEMNDSEDSK